MELERTLPHSKVPATCPFLSQLDPMVGHPRFFFINYIWLNLQKLNVNYI